MILAARTTTTVRRCTARTGFTILEATISVALVALVIVASLQVSAASVRMRQIGRDQPHAHHLARDLLSEVVQRAYEDPDQLPQFGPETGEPMDVRDGWDDVDDFAGWTRSPPEIADGRGLDAYAGWTRSVDIAYVRADAPDAIAGSDTGFKRIVVTVTDPRGRSLSLSGLRSRGGAFDLDPSGPRGAVITRAEAVLQVGANPEAWLLTSVPLLNSAPATAANLLQNGGAEAGVAPWTSKAVIETTSGDARAGSAAFRISARGNGNEGAEQLITAPMVSGTTYDWQVWVRSIGGADTFRLVLKTDGSSGGPSEIVSSNTNVGAEWTLIQGQFVPVWSGDLDLAELRIETASSDDFEFDAAALWEGS